MDAMERQRPSRSQSVHWRWRRGGDREGPLRGQSRVHPERFSQLSEPSRAPMSVARGPRGAEKEESWRVSLVRFLERKGWLRRPSLI